MKYATTQELIRINDEAVLNNFNEWLTIPFFDDVRGDGLHILVHAIPHGPAFLNSQARQVNGGHAEACPSLGPPAGVILGTLRRA